jgi:drug/metabolite transporter (DMT)-like permease
MKSQQQLLIGAAMVLLSAIAFSSKAIIVKLAYVYPVNAATLIALRMAFSIPFFVGLAVWVHAQPHTVSLDRLDKMTLLVLAIVGGYGSMWLNFEGLAHVTAGLERVILFLYPTLVVLMSAVMFRHAITRREIFAMITSYAGVVLVVWHDVGISTQDTLLGAGLVLASAIVYAGYLIVSGRLIPKMGASMFTAYTMMIASAASGVHFLLTEPIAVMLHLPMQVYGLSLLMAVVATVLPSILMNMGIQRLGSNRAALMSAIGPVATIVLAYFFLGEPLSWIQGLGTLLVLVGVIAVSLTKAA